MGEFKPIIRLIFSDDSFQSRWKLDGAARRYRPASGSGTPGFGSIRGREAKTSQRPDSRGRRCRRPKRIGARPLGLPVVKQIVEQDGRGVEIETEEGRGTHGYLRPDPGVERVGVAA